MVLLQISDFNLIDDTLLASVESYFKLNAHLFFLAA